MPKRGYLILENGQIHEGDSFGYENDIDGEVVFNTGMTGYPEGFTDPSYFGQILTMTYPLIGNYGVPSIDSLESDRVQIRALVVSSYVENNSHWQSKTTLSQWLKKEKIPAISGIDTRTLTKTLREKGVLKGKMLFTPPKKFRGFSFYDVNNDNLVKYVSTQKNIIYGNGKLKILLLDCGLKNSQIKFLLNYDTTVIRVPWNFDPFKNKSTFDALMISNGPGDPKKAVESISIVKKSLEHKIPTLGICLGNQILALAAGADTYKLKYGHRGQNQPVKEEKTGRCFITTQNHGFAVDTKTIPSGWEKWFTNLNDNTNEGIRHTKFPFYSSQFHPESTPGPVDTEWIFEFFVNEAKKWLKLN